MGVTTDQQLDVTTITQSNGAGGDGFDADILDVQAFFENVLCEYSQGTDANLAADANLARSIIPAGTAAMRDFSYLAPEIPEFIPDNCVGCMTCVIQCPDTAILAKVIEEDVLEVELGLIDNSSEAHFMQGQFTDTKKFYHAPKKRGKDPGMFGIFIDPTKCKG